MSDLPESARGSPDAIAELQSEHLEDAREVLGYPACRNCRCTDLDGCPEGCWWVEPALCSNCEAAPPAERGGGCHAAAA